eukprot:CAMPEP_0206135196 /NCGR_PEP_ID=MMETSP1473-20131121/528_1 /ASSEMBLY_ACC=CAM_ASM_001109 /TAXON_ID=1461547 /ORGANISM="Stichococcus sp, Strain RCC1054" /LENGTH=286 /DNA_ID=CAMNT_0053526959 /DNA_START=137 /DNA_END=997 /DNA_ORIENTATION=-
MERGNAILARFEKTPFGQWLTYPGPDSRTADWPLMHWSWALGITTFYILSIPVGNAIMRQRAPFKLKGFSMLHNFAMFSLSLYMSIECIRQSYRNFGWGAPGGFRLWCNQNDGGRPAATGFSDSGRALATVLWIHYVSKAWEFFDTWIMILKKNTRQISFLHVYHHATTFAPVWWAVVRYGPGGEAWFCCALNSAIHVLMYGYYFLATLGFKSTAVKKAVTMSQMIQFCAFIAQGTWILYVKACYTPRLAPVFLVFQCVVFFVLFANFYQKTYIMGPKPGSSKKSV